MTDWQDKAIWVESRQELRDSQNPITLWSPVWWKRWRWNNRLILFLDLGRQHCCYRHNCWECKNLARRINSTTSVARTKVELHHHNNYEDYLYDCDWLLNQIICPWKTVSDSQSSVAVVVTCSIYVCSSLPVILVLSWLDNRIGRVQLLLGFFTVRGGHSQLCWW